MTVNREGITEGGVKVSLSEETKSYCKVIFTHDPGLAYGDLILGHEVG